MKSCLRHRQLAVLRRTEVQVQFAGSLVQVAPINRSWWALHEALQQTNATDDCRCIPRKLLLALAIDRVKRGLWADTTSGTYQSLVHQNLTHQRSATAAAADFTAALIVAAECLAVHEARTRSCCNATHEPEQEQDVEAELLFT